MATKISITKKLEAELRGAVDTKGASLGDDAWDALRNVVGLIDATRSKASGSGPSALSPGKFVEALHEHRPVVLPPSGPMSNQAFGRLGRALATCGVTEEQAAALGVWLAGPGMKAAPGEITIDRIIKNLGDWVTRAVANKPEWSKPEW